jgi:hypothetical protein
VDLILATRLIDTFKDIGLIGSTFVVLFGLVWAWGWLLKNFGTF